MSNFFLLNEAIDSNDFESFKQAISELVSIDKNIGDEFFKHDSLWQLDIINELYSNYGGFDEKAICIFIEQLKHSEKYFKNETEIDLQFPVSDNAFLGIDFSKLAILKPRQIVNSATYDKFNFDNLWNVTFKNFWDKRERLFPNLILCGDVEQQILRIGTSNYFEQITNRLKEFNLAIGNWKVGNFSYPNINRNYSLVISPESSQTMSKFGNERIFPLPDGGTCHFELHIKTGDLRFHFFPDNATRKVYVGYIGHHLSTVTN